MAEHFIHRRRFVPIAAAAAAAAVLAAGGTAVALRADPASAGNGAAGASAPGSTTTVAPAPAMQITATDPSSGATGVDGSAAVVITTSSPVDPGLGLPAISPPVAGTWTASGDQLSFAPSGAFMPSTTYTVTVPASLRGAVTSPLGSPRTWSFTTAQGSVVRLQQDLALLGYLPLSWAPTPGQTSSPGQGASAASPAAQIYHPPAGHFTWTWASPPPSLAATWVPGQYTVMVQGAVMAFEADHGLSTDGIAGPQVWSDLLAATTSTSPPVNQHGYTYALARKTSPETLTVWHNGTVISTSPTNTGIPQAPTQDGTYPVYERLATQVMRGTNPDGTKYADPVAWVAYFHGGDAIHYIARSSYGSPQSLGCLEVPYAVGQHIWPYLTLGSLVTVAG